ncbi:MAG: 50S ribosomal protein L16 [Candidatus Wildermuthbacteria bacterium]|nr:50S ribosomal protein L16 [Candidatus Wildermuthbacteria bacterium]
MLTPRKVKFRKQQRGRSKGIDRRATELAFGTYGLKSLGSHWIAARQIEAARRAIIRYLKKGGKVWVRIFPDKPVSTKGPESPMGGGKGAVDHYAFPIRPGRIIFEIEGIPEEMAKQALAEAASKLPVKTRIIQKQ